MVHCVTEVYESDGLLGVYRGFMVSVDEIMFGSYDMLRPKDDSLLVNYLFAQSLITVSGFLEHPFDTVCRQLMKSNGPET